MIQIYLKHLLFISLNYLLKTLSLFIYEYEKIDHWTDLIKKILEGNNDTITITFFRGLHLLTTDCNHKKERKVHDECFCVLERK